jgi:hypothetical protein
MRIRSAVRRHPRWALALASTAGAAALVGAAVPAASAAPVAARVVVVKATSPASGSATYHGTAGHAARVARSAQGMSGLHAVSPSLGTAGKNRVIQFRSPGGPYPAHRGLSGPAAKVNASAVISAASIAGASGGSVLHKFNGLSDVDSNNLNGFPLTPPDQGLCVGRDATLPGSPKAVWEPVNLAARETSANGTALRPDVNLATLFQDPFAEGDVRCLYDPATRSFYFTEIGFPVATGPAPDFNNTTVDVLVTNSHGAAAYQFDTSLGGPTAGDCFGDQPKVGFDNNALVISTDEFCGPTETNYEGAIVLAISKSQLVNEDATVNEALFGPVSLGHIPGLGLDPAIQTGTATGYLVNSFPYDQFGNNNSVADTLGLWKLRNGASVTTGSGTPTLTGKIIPSEGYAFPVPAASTGDGSTTAGITSEAFLNPDDSRVNAPVVVTRTSSGGIRLWTALDTAVSINADPSARDGAAWFRINPATSRVVGQGYVAAKGKYLLYPAIQPRPSGPAAMVFTITSTSINPSAAFTTLGSAIRTVAAGAGPHLSFCDTDPSCLTPRWGDYSFAAVDPSGNGVWLATEYIPAPADQDPSDNWGTFVFEVSRG